MTVHNLPNSPSAVLDPVTAETIRRSAAKSEAGRQLDPSVLDLIKAKSWFRMLVPKRYGGLELTLPEVLRLEEAIAWCDGSTGWVVTLCSGAGWFAGFANADVAERFFSAPDSCIAGSGAISGNAEQLSSGYQVSGRWPYATGSLHATSFTANCRVFRDGHPVLDTEGSPRIDVFVFDRSEVFVSDNWRGMGMIATGSHSFGVENLMVGEERRFSLGPSAAKVEGALYRYPFLQFAEATLAVNLSGMAVRFADLTATLLGDGPNGEFPADSRRRLDEAREILFELADRSWNILVSGSLLEYSLLTGISEAARNLVQVSRQEVSGLYPLCGLRAADVTNEINRVWRDFHTASQHGLFK